MNLGLIFVFFLGDLRQLFQEDHPNTICAILFFFFFFNWTELFLICTGLFVNDKFYFQMSMTSLDIKKIKLLTKNECALVFH